MAEACQKASRWQPALSLLAQLRESNSTSAPAYRATILAADRGGEPLLAMKLLDSRLETGVSTRKSSKSRCFGAQKVIRKTCAARLEDEMMAQGSAHLYELASVSCRSRSVHICYEGKHAWKAQHPETEASLGCFEVVQTTSNQRHQNLAGLEPDSATYDSGISSCRAVLRGLQAESSTLPNLLGEACDLELELFWAVKTTRGRLETSISCMKSGPRVPP